jgi:hypothetical protein
MLWALIMKKKNTTGDLKMEVKFCMCKVVRNKKI